MVKLFCFIIVAVNLIDVSRSWAMTCPLILGAAAAGKDTASSLNDGYRHLTDDQLLDEINQLALKSLSVEIGPGRFPVCTDCTYYLDPSDESRKHFEQNQTKGTFISARINQLDLPFISRSVELFVSKGFPWFSKNVSSKQLIEEVYDSFLDFLTDDGAIYILADREEPKLETVFEYHLRLAEERGLRVQEKIISARFYALKLVLQ